MNKNCIDYDSEEERLEEIEIIRAFEAGELKSSQDEAKEIRIARIAAKNFFSHNKKKLDHELNMKKLYYGCKEIMDLYKPSILS